MGNGSIGHPKRGDVVYHLLGHQTPRIAIVLKSTERLGGEPWKCDYSLLVGINKSLARCSDVFLTWKEAEDEHEDRDWASFGPPTFESDFSVPGTGDPHWREKREIKHHKLKHEEPKTSE
jgi:hypothetical protein